MSGDLLWRGAILSWIRSRILIVPSLVPGRDLAGISQKRLPPQHLTPAQRWLNAGSACSTLARHWVNADADVRILNNSISSVSGSVIILPDLINRTTGTKIQYQVIIKSNQIKSNLFAQQLTLYRQNHIHLHVLKTYYIIILQIHGYIK